MDIQKIPTDKIKHAEYNPRKNLKPGDAEYEKLKRSIEEFGYVEPVIWNSRTGNIVGGHQRAKVLVQLGVNEIDCVVVDMDGQKEKALNVALNKISGEWDEEALVGLLGELGELTELAGFDAKEIDELFDKFTDKGEAQEDGFDADAEVAKITSPVARRGDVWQLGRHRLVCGDSTLAGDLKC